MVELNGRGPLPGAGLVPGEEALTPKESKLCSASGMLGCSVSVWEVSRGAKRRASCERSVQMALSAIRLRSMTSASWQ